MMQKHDEEKFQLEGLMEDRNSELVEAVKVMRETTGKNIMTIAGVEKALMLEKATSARLQQTLIETREDLSQSESALAAVASNEQVREEVEGLRVANGKQEVKLKAMKEGRARQE